MGATMNKILCAAIDLGSRQLDTEAPSRARDFVWEEPEESGVLTPDSFEKKTRAEPPTFLRPGLFIGSISAERDLQVLRKYGITHVLQVSTLPVKPPSTLADDFANVAMFWIL